MFEKSIDSLLWDVYEIAAEMAFTGIKPNKQPKHISDDDWDLIWSFVDGLYQKRILNILERKCSDKEFREFSLENEEKRLEEILEKFKRLNI